MVDFVVKYSYTSQPLHINMHLNSLLYMCMNNRQPCIPHCQGNFLQNYIFLLRVNFLLWCDCLVEEKEVMEQWMNELVEGYQEKRDRETVAMVLPLVC